MSADSSARRRRILVLTSTFPRWEGDREPPFVFELSKRLAARFDVTVLAPHAQNARTAHAMDGIEVRRFRYAPQRWQTLAYQGGILANLKSNRLNYLLVPFFILAQFICLVRLLRTTRFDAIHAHWLIPQGLVALAARALSPMKPAIVCTSHGGDLYGLSGAFFGWLKRQVIRRVDKLTVVSRAMREHAAALSGRSDIEVISMGVDLKQRFVPPVSPAARRVHELLFVGRLVEKKGVRYLIEAMPAILERHPQVTLLIAGDGPDRASLEAQAAAAGLTDRVRFLGAVQQDCLPGLYRRTGIFIAPSIVAHGGDQEGLGLVLVEALGCGGAVVATDLPAIGDVVIDRVTGLCCKQKDSADLENKILFLLDNPALRDSLGRAGREHVTSHFDWEIIADRYIRLIQESSSGDQ